MKDEDLKVKSNIEELKDGGNEYEVSSNFGILIRHYRTKVKDYSLQELEERSCVSASYIHRLETGQRKSPSITKVLQIAEALSIPNSILVATIMRNNPEIDADSLADVLIKNDFGLDDKLASKDVKNLLIRLLEMISQVEWSAETKFRDLMKIGEVIDDLKLAM